MSKQDEEIPEDINPEGIEKQIENLQEEIQNSGDQHKIEPKKTENQELPKIEEKKLEKIIEIPTPQFHAPEQKYPIKLEKSIENILKTDRTRDKNNTENLINTDRTHIKSKKMRIFCILEFSA